MTEMRTQLLPITAQPVAPLIDSAHFWDAKDPCPVFDGKEWHIYASGGKHAPGLWRMYHAVAPALEGPWREIEPAVLPDAHGGCPAAPGMVYDADKQVFHMFIQTDCFALDGTIEHRISHDGHTFHVADVALTSLPNSDEAGIYDPHPAEIGGQKYITYSGMPTVGRPDIYLAKSTTNTWDGPWERIGKILSHEQVVHHNQHDHHDYEWGLEGSQLLELPDGRILLNAVCFLPEGTRGTRQRVFFAIAESVTGPYYSLGPVIMPPQEGWESAENGHAAVVLEAGVVHLFYQARSHTTPWRFGHCQLVLR